ncbi:hypothetical protein SADUNF_Sadunf12G0043600 [Salix dunnii]|uniref:SURP motif domain-containing protein n=1 Tax=Salix dunnii TaxID=1413687 RepID=A0A835JLG3_9ROSI|nr:hypothetical protein SADUNF_Sadunf12G0043600 [Salix dunnii]
MNTEEDDFVFYGTPIEREEDLTSRKKKAVAEASGHLRTLPSWKQEVRDEEGRRRFHGAFTGGFSAGYYNTAGSKEGWTPQTFTSSRKNRAEFKQQSMLNFLDEDEKEELEGRSLGTASQFDTFGFTAAEIARKQAEKEQQKSVKFSFWIANYRPSAVPGPAPDEIVLPATESIGVKLLLKMGWRHGHSIKDSHVNSLYKARREARKAFLAFSSDDAKSQPEDSEPGEEDHKRILDQPVVDDFPSSQSTPVRISPVYILNPKEDTHGLGYDPYKHAPEFREKKRTRVSGKQGHGNKQALSIKDSLFGLKFTFGPSAGRAAPVYEIEDTYIQEDEEPIRSTTENMPKLVWKEQGVLSGFKVALNSDYQLERFDPPVIPKDFLPHHKFPGPLEFDNKPDTPPEVPPPDDENLKVLIEGVATLVARCGKLFEDLSREKNQSNPLFSFLTGGNGHEYYSRKLWEEQQKRNGQKKIALDGKFSSSVDKMTVESRGKILGEMPLERSSRDLSSSIASVNVNLPFNLSDTFTKPESSSEFPEVAKPFQDDPGKQARFEQFLKEKYQGGIRSTVSSGASNMSEAARARERLDFEAAAEVIEKGKFNKENKLHSQQLMGFSASGGMQLTFGGLQQVKDTLDEDLATKKIYPRREEFQWRPSAILCKRFDLIDPYMGKPPPPPRMRSKMDSLIVRSDLKAMKMEEAFSADRNQPLALQFSTQEVSKDVVDRETEPGIQVENVERPVDLYKAIFSDDSDDEIEASNLNTKEDPEKKVEVVHSTLNRLMAGDFLESLGKELGLEVPPNPPYSTNIAGSSRQKESAIANPDNVNILSVEENSFSIPIAHGVSRKERAANDEKTAKKGESGKDEQPGPSKDKSDKVHSGKIAREDRKKAKLPPGLHRKRTSTSSEDERNRKRSRRHRYSSSDSYSDSSNDHRDRHHSRSKGRKKRSSREKASSKKHHKHR